MVGNMEFQAVLFFLDWMLYWILCGVYQLGGGVVAVSWLFKAMKEQDVNMGCWDQGVEIV
jgi:hypothetical protein